MARSERISISLEGATIVERSDGERRGFRTALTTAKKSLKAKKQELLDHNALVEQNASLPAVQKAVDSLSWWH